MIKAAALATLCLGLNPAEPESKDHFACMAYISGVQDGIEDDCDAGRPNLYYRFMELAQDRGDWNAVDVIKLAHMELCHPDSFEPE